jgi:hypothetical protein
MARVSVRQTYPASVHEALSCWCEVRRWPEWVDGLARIVSVDAQWPEAGSAVVWQSSPAGRGRVTERVTAFEPLAELTVAVEDEAIEGRQRVVFDPVEDGVAVEVTLEYRIRRRSPLTLLIGWLFVRRPMTLSLSRTLECFGPVLEGSRAPGLG